MELGAADLGTGLSGGGPSSGSADDYYKSLLARVDNAIVETKSGEDGEEEGVSVTVCCAGCLGWSRRLLLWAATTVGDCCVDLSTWVKRSAGGDRPTAGHVALSV